MEKSDFYIDILEKSICIFNFADFADYKQIFYVKKLIGKVKFFFNHKENKKGFENKY